MASNVVIFNASRPPKYLTSAAVFFGSYSVGLMTSMAGPAMISFAEQFNTTVEDASRIITVTQACYVLGALSASFVFRWVNRHHGAILLLLVIASGITALPHATSIAVFYTVGGIYGLAFGMYDPAQIAWMIDIWRNESGPFILTQHFFYSCGALTAPLLVGPFLSNDKDENISTSTTPVPPDPSQLEVPFLVAGLIVSAAAVGLIALLFPYRKSTEKSKGSIQFESNSKESTCPAVEEESNAMPIKRKVTVIILCCLVVGFYQSMDINTMSFFTSYAYNLDVGLSQAASARIQSAMTFGYAGGRGLGIFLIRKIPPHFILAGNIVLMTVGNTILFVLGVSSVTWLWVGSICLGFGFSTVFPAFFAYIEKHLFVSNSVAGILATSAGAMTTIYPFIIGSQVESFPKILNYMDYINISVVTVSFVILFKLTHSKCETSKDNNV